MKVLFKATFCGSNEYYAGQVYDLSETEGRAVVENGFGEEVKESRTASVELKNTKTANKKV